MDRDVGGARVVTLVEAVFGPDAGDDSPAPGRTVKDAIQAALAARNARTVRLVHPTAPEWTAVYRVPVDRAEVKRLLDASEKRAKGSEVTFDPALLASTCVRVEFAGTGLLTDADGTPLTWRDQEMWDLVGGTGAIDTVRRAYGDGVVAALAKRLLDEAGYGSDDEVIVEDPL